MPFWMLSLLPYLSKAKPLIQVIKAIVDAVNTLGKGQRLTEAQVEKLATSSGSQIYNLAKRDKFFSAMTEEELRTALISTINAAQDWIPCFKK